MVKKIPTRTLYEKRPPKEYKPVFEDINPSFRFPQGRWVLVVNPGQSCCLNALPNVDEAVHASLQAVRWNLEELLVAKSKARESYDATLSLEKRQQVSELLEGYNYLLTFDTVSGIVDAALRELAPQISKEVTSVK